MYHINNKNPITLTFKSRTPVNATKQSRDCSLNNWTWQF